METIIEVEELKNIVLSFGHFSFVLVFPMGI